MSENDQIEQLSLESITRIYEINRLKDIMDENQQDLRNLGVERIVFFGSAMKGTANRDSDIDLAVIHKPHDYDSPRYLVQAEQFEDELLNILGEIQFHPPQAGAKQDAIHVSLIPNNLEHLSDGGRLAFLQDAITMWKKI